MAISFTGTLLPMIGNRLIHGVTGQALLTCFKLFGSGVILATGFVHMLIPSTIALTDKCLPQSFQSYSALSGVFAIVGILLTHLIQTYAGKFIKDSQSVVKGSEVKHLHASDLASTSDDVSQQTLDNVELQPVVLHHEGHTHSHGLPSNLVDPNKRLLVYMLELGIASHSIMVGVALGIATDEFISLLIALSFHQFFEGIALSAVVIEARFEKMIMNHLMVVLYTLTTPIGIVIGIGIHQSFSMDATGSLISQGVIDAVSAGILIYDSLVNVIVPHFTSPYFQTSSAAFQATQFTVFYFGVGIMALIGCWA